jgi:hypothetical protein
MGIFSRNLVLIQDFTIYGVNEVYQHQNSTILMKKSFFCGFVALMAIASHAQDFAGYRDGNYSGVNGVFFNPANIADSRYKLDINLFSLSTSLGNNQASYSLKNIGETFNGDSIKNQIFGNNAGPASGQLNLNMIGPSFMVNLDQKSAFAVTTRGRTMMNVIDIDGKLINQVLDDMNYNDPALPYTISSGQNMRVAINAWSEIGLSYSRVLYAKDKNFLKAGVTVKYLGGVGNAFLNIDNLKATINADEVARDAYLNNTTGRIGVGLGGVNVTDFDPGDLPKMESTGLGFDLGFVYEFRPAQSTRRDQNKYKFKLGVALLDIGSIKYDKDMGRSGSYDINVTGSERLYFNDFDNVDIDQFRNYFESRPQYFTAANTNAETSYSVSLPTTLHVDMDYHLSKGFYISAASQLSLAGKMAKAYNPLYYSGFSITPRVEGKSIGLYVPVSYNELTKMNAGVTLRLGPLFVGSASALSALMGESKQADVHVGLRFGFMRKK